MTTGSSLDEPERVVPRRAAAAAASAAALATRDEPATPSKSSSWGSAPSGPGTTGPSLTDSAHRSEDLFQRRLPGGRLVEPVLPHRDHPLLDGEPLDVAGDAVRNQQVVDLLRHLHDLV